MPFNRLRRHNGRLTARPASVASVHGAGRLPLGGRS